MQQLRCFSSFKIPPMWGKNSFLPHGEFNTNCQNPMICLKQSGAIEKKSLEKELEWILL